MKITKEEKTKAIEYLKDYLKQSNRIYTSIDHVSKSGMQRIVKAYIIINDNILHISHLIGKAAGYRFKNDANYYGCVVNGCGFDAGYELVDAVKTVTGIKDINHQSFR